MSRCVVVLGMHRSGTSCVTRMLHHLGVYLGDNLDDEPAPTNLTGHWEGRETIAINDEILSQSGGNWHDLPEHLIWNAACEQRIQQAVAQLASRPVYGWKDPRTTITFPAWKPYLPDRAILACIRHPRAVAESLALRDGFTIERGVELWTAYNQHLLQNLADESHVFWFAYDEPPEMCEIQLRRLCAYLELPYRQDVMALFNPYLRHFQASEGPIAAQAVELYETLLAKALQACGESMSVVPTPEVLVSKNESSLAAEVSHPALQQNLEEVLRNFGIAQQRYWRAVSDLQQMTAEKLARSTEERLAEGLERARIDTERIAALDRRLVQEFERVTTAVEQQGAATQESVRQVEVQLAARAAEQAVAATEQANIDRERIAVLEARLALIEEHLSQNLVRRWLRLIPGLRPVYHLARRALYANS